ncbi:MAG: site-2 protease family protein [Bacillota bacterium]|nr:site-2 protease family protein [Bacillota bacterium]
MPIFPVSGLLGLFQNFDLQSFLILILVLCISLSFHEAAHAWAAWRLGDDTASLQGRLTMNPLAHLDPIGSIVFLIAGIGWARPVPVNPSRFDRKVSMKKGMMLTSLAGPTANLLLATVSAFLLFMVVTITLSLAGAGASILQVLISLLQRLYGANIILAVFNLLPVPPLDGFKIFGYALPDRLYYRLMSYERYIGIAFLLLVFFARGTLTNIISWVALPFNMIIYRPIEFIFNWFWQIIGLI